MARAIALFPAVDKVNMLVQKFMKGYGVMSRRVPSGWTIPAFSAFAVKAGGIDIEDDSTTQGGISADNQINQAVYGRKAREVLLGKTPVDPPVPPAVNESQSLLTSLWKQ